MQLENIGRQLSAIIRENIDEETQTWLEAKIAEIIDEGSKRQLYLTYSLLASKIKTQGSLILPVTDPELKGYLGNQNASLLQLARIYLLIKVLEANSTLFTPMVSEIIQVADTSELVTFLKFLILLPKPENFIHPAVDALRTNISTVFDAIALHNPYPARYFDEDQWNQMFLKTAFMQGDLSAIMEIDKRANKKLTRIISDYAHERWAASRDIDPYFWRPVARFLDAKLLIDMRRLLESSNAIENKAAALCCYKSENPEAKKLLESFPGLQEQILQNKISWETLKD
tara:strand:+ start:3051 stop:3908 length:858 start_codon:yes stop_codon:yes gene_type:complete